MANLNPAAFNALRGRNEAALTALGLDNPDAALPESPRERAKALALFDQRACIELLSSTAWQRAKVPDWHEHFFMLREVNMEMVRQCGLPGIQSVQHLRSALWHGGKFNPLGGLPDCAFRRFQLVFADPPHLVLPRFDVKDGKIVFRQDPHSLSVAPCLVAVDRIPEELAIDLGLISYDGGRRTRLYRLSRKGTEEVIQGLKKIWDNSECLESRNKRIMIIRQHPSRELAHADVLADIANPSAHLLGRILYTRNVEGGNSSPELDYYLTTKGRPYARLSVQLFPSIFAAHRKTIYETSVHDSEIKKVVDLKHAAAIQSDRLKEEWCSDADPKLKKQLESETKALALRGRDLLAEVSNRHKRFALELFDRIDGVSDRTGRPNPIAVTSRLLRACMMLEKRLIEIAPIGGVNRQDQILLAKRIDAHKSATEAIRGDIPKLARTFKMKLAIFSGRSLSPKNPEKEPDVIKREVRNFLGQVAIPSHIDSLTDQPYLPIRERFASLWSDLRNNCENRSPEDAARTLVKIHVVGKFSRLLEALEELKGDLASTTLTLEAAADRMWSLEALYDAREILPDVVVPEYVAQYEEMSSKLKNMREDLEKRCAENLSDERRNEVLSEFKDDIAEIDVGAIVEKLR
jgi:hypothetical protein